MASLVITPARSEVVQFSRSFWEEDTVVLFKLSGNNWTFWLDPLDWSLWATFFAAAVLVSILICIGNQGIFFHVYLKRSTFAEKTEWIFISLEHLTQKCESHV